MSYFDDNEGYFDDNEDHETVRCAYCQTIGTWWHTGERWRMIGPDGKFHVCMLNPRAPAAPDEFEDVS